VEHKKGNENCTRVLIEMSVRLGGSNAKSKECQRKIRPVCEIAESILEQVLKKMINAE
jgi:hypothetical protein